MRAFFLLALFLPATAFAAPPRVRLLSVADGTARIRVGDGSAETRISSLVHSLHSAGITSFIFEANSDILLTKLRSRWLDTGIRNVTILPPAPPSAANYPKLDPIEAGVALKQIDREITSEAKIFSRSREDLINFVSENGFPENDDSVTPENLISKKERAEAQLRQFMSSAPDDQLKLSTGIDLPGNPVAKHLASYQEALKKSRQLKASGFGSKHPDRVAAIEVTEATHQIALDELGSVEEGMRVKIYQLEKRIEHLPIWRRLSETERESMTQAFQKKRAAYEASLHRILGMKAARKAAERSLEAVE